VLKQFTLEKSHQLDKRVWPNRFSIPYPLIYLLFEIFDVLMGLTFVLYFLSPADDNILILILRKHVNMSYWNNNIYGI